MRYKDTEQVHMDFHRTTNGTIAYLRKYHGEEFLRETFRRTARDVYRAIHEDLKRGDPEQLLEHWAYYFDREGGEYRIDRKEDQIVMTVTRCPAIAYLEGRGIEVDTLFCQQTVVINETLAEDTPFEITTNVLSGGRCVQTIRRTS